MRFSEAYFESIQHYRIREFRKGIIKKRSHCLFILMCVIIFTLRICVMVGGWPSPLNSSIR